MAEKHALASVASTDITARDFTIVAVPLGSCEQHGPHLPLGTDSIIADYLCQQLASHLASIVVAPTIAISASGEHAGFAGTLSIGTDALSTVLTELVRSADWADAVIFVNGHGGNAEAVTRALRTAKLEGRKAIAWWPSLPDADAHAPDDLELSFDDATLKTLFEREELRVKANGPATKSLFPRPRAPLRIKVGGKLSLDRGKLVVFR